MFNLERIKANAVFVLAGASMILAVALSKQSKEYDESEAIALMSPAEKLVVFELFNKTRHTLRNNGSQVNYFKDELLRTLIEIRETAPTRPTYFFCQTKEFGQVIEYIVENKHKMGVYPEVLNTMYQKRSELCPLPKPKA